MRRKFSFRLPLFLGGVLVLISVGNLSAGAANANPSIVATLTPSRTIQVQGSGFLPQQAVEVATTFGTLGQTVTSYTTDTQGSFVSTENVPESFVGTASIRASQKQLKSPSSGSSTSPSSAVPAAPQAAPVPAPASVAPQAATNTPSAAPLGTKPLALVFRGEDTCNDCAEAFTDLLKSSQWNFEVKYVGPLGEKLTPELLASAALYGQPGGGDSSEAAFPEVAPYKEMIRRYIQGGGRYLGICMGGYFAGSSMLDLIPGGTTDQYIDKSGATVQSTADTVVNVVDWTGKTRGMFFQDGNYIELNRSTPGTTVVAEFTDGRLAAAVVANGNGRVAVSGPHPEARADWYAYNNLKDPDGPDADLGHHMIDLLMK